MLEKDVRKRKKFKFFYEPLSLFLIWLIEKNLNWDSIKFNYSWWTKNKIRQSSVQFPVFFWTRYKDKSLSDCLIGLQTAYNCFICKAVDCFFDNKTEVIILCFMKIICFTFLCYVVIEFKCFLSSSLDYGLKSYLHWKRYEIMP